MDRIRLLYESEINVIYSGVKILYLNLGELLGRVNFYPMPGGMEMGGFHGTVPGGGNETKGELELKGNVEKDEKRQKKTCLEEL
jgi:hypothetical protein